MKMNIRITKQVILIFTMLVFAHSVVAVSPVYVEGKSGYAIRGYDTVAYFTENKPVKGLEQFQVDYKEATWLFSSKKNLDLFKQSPERYAPQYGGYCSYAVANNTTASIKPEFFTILNGKLYLNYNKAVNNRWSKDREQYIDEANENWPNLLAK